MKKEITSEIRMARDYKVTLEANIDKVLKNGFFNKTSIKDRIEFLKELASAKSALWSAVYRQFPEIKGIPVVSVTENYVEWESPEVLESNL